MKSEMKNAHMFSQFQSAIRNSHVPSGLRAKICRASLALTLLGLMLFFGSVARAATFHVTTTTDNNNNANATPGSLRKAIVDANTNPGTDTIDFNIPGAGVHRFSLTAALPVISDPVVIDGYTQPGAVQNSLANSNNAVLLIEITGTNLFNFSVDNGLAITAGSTTIRGLIINGFKGTGKGTGSGIRISNKGQNVIAGNFIGTDFNGTNQIPNGDGIEIVGSDNNVIGGNQPFSRNLISGNAKEGIDIQVDGSYNNLIVGNFIGTNRSGTGALGNGGSGIAIGDTGTASSGGEIGGTFAGAGNVISANLGEGISLWGTTTGVKIEGNLIGTDITGKVGLGNTYNGVELQTTGTGNVIGGPTVTARNIISANGGAITVFEGDSTIILGNYIGTDITGKVGLGNKAGVYIVSSFNTLGGIGATDGNVISANGEYGIYIADSKGNFVNRNLIGIGADGTTALGNNGPGIIVYNGSNNIIGGSVAGSNAIAFNAGPGVRLGSGNNNQITYNSISSNQDLGIDLDPQGVTSNDPGDADTGPNNLQNYPVVTSAVPLSGFTNVFGTLNSTPNSKFRLEFFANATCDSSGFGEGAVFVGATDATTDANGNANFAPAIGLVPVGQFLTATATGPGGNTSEFSKCVQVQSGISISDYSHAEGNTGTTPFNFTVSLSAPSGLPISVDYTTTVFPSTAHAGSDFQDVTGTLTFAPGETAKQISVLVNGDTQLEPDEIFFVSLTTSTNAFILFSTGAGSILNDDTAQAGTLALSAASYSVNENGGHATITVTRNAGSNGAVSVQYATANGSATAGGDYTAGSSTLNWADGDAVSKTFTIPIVNDSVDEADETVSLALSNPTGGATLGSPASAVLTIVDDDAAPKVSINDVSSAEGNSGTTAFTFTISVDAASGQTVSVNYTTADNTAQETSDYQATNGVVTFAPGETSKQVTVLVNGDTQVESNETLVVNLYNLSNVSVGKVTGVGTIVDDDSTSTSSTIQFGQATYLVQEDLSAMTVTVTRSGDTSGAASVDYTTADASAIQKTDFEYAAGTLTFAPGETSKTFSVLINEDMFNEGNETFNVTLSNPAGAALGLQSVAMVTIGDDLSESISNPIDDPQVFVYTHYHDFLNREPDPAGLAFWTSQITSCGSDAQCIENARINVSASFFLSIEFQETAYLLYLMQKESYSTMPKYASFMRDLQEVSRGVVVNEPGWQQKLSANQQQLADQWVNRPEFKAAYDALSNDAYVNALYKNAGIAAPQTEKDKLVAALNTASMNRSAVLLEVAADATFRQQEQNAAFVLMEYFGYLRRDPNAAPDSDFSGYNFWLNKLNQFGGNYINAEMIKSFTSSFEYRQRFGQ